MEAFKFSFTLTGKGWDSSLPESIPDYPNPPDKTVVLKVNGKHLINLVFLGWKPSASCLRVFHSSVRDIMERTNLQ